MDAGSAKKSPASSLNVDPRERAFTRNLSSSIRWSSHMFFPSKEQPAVFDGKAAKGLRLSAGH